MTKICKTEYTCTCCDYKTFRQSSYNTHLKSEKHIRNANNPNPDTTARYVCECGKRYQVYNSFFYHKRACMFVPKSDETALTIDMIEKINTSVGETLIDEKANSLLELLRSNFKDSDTIEDMVNSLQLVQTTIAKVLYKPFLYPDFINELITRYFRSVSIDKRPVHYVGNTIFVNINKQWYMESYDKFVTNTFIAVSHGYKIKQHSLVYFIQCMKEKYHRSIDTIYENKSCTRLRIRQDYDNIIPSCGIYHWLVMKNILSCGLSSEETILTALDMAV
jgi:hypothetical protein